MARIHDLFIVELAEVIKGYGNDPDVEDPFSLSEFYRFYELPNIAVSRENFEKMRPVESERKRGEWKRSTDNGYSMYECSVCESRMWKTEYDKAVGTHGFKFCPYCGADMRGGDSNE